jgi:hypothetical protein
MYFGNFTALRPEVIVWRTKLLNEILDGRRATLGNRVQAGIATEAQAKLFDELLSRLQIWLIVTSDEEKSIVKETLGSLNYSFEVFSVDEVKSELAKLGKESA